MKLATASALLAAALAQASGDADEWEAPGPDDRAFIP